MKDKYWAKNKYSSVNPTDYNIVRFASPAGKIIDEAEKNTILELLKRYAFHNSPSRRSTAHLEGAKKLKILDVATGAGRLAFYLEKHFPFAEITGVDINENMLDNAQQMARENKSKVKFTRGDIYHLPFKDGQFDAVAGLRFSMHIPQVGSVIKEFSRIIKKDGLLIFDIFNYQSIFKISVRYSKKEESGFYTIKEMTQIAENYKYKLLEYKGILLFGETLLRKFPDKFQFLLSPFLKPPELIEKFSTKLIICFKKI